MRPRVPSIPSARPTLVRVTCRHRMMLTLSCLVLIAACAGEPPQVDKRAAPRQQALHEPSSAPDLDDQGDGVEPVGLVVDVGQQRGIISPLIRGFSGGADGTAMRDAGLRLNSWGGNPSTRYNYQLGNAWNAGRDWSYRNGDYGVTGDAASAFIGEARSAGAVTRLAVPTLGWVAKDADNSTCSFPAEDGSCDDGDGADCSNPGVVADPAMANVPSTADMVREWVEDLSQDFDIRFIAMDNEPELWGVTHYDVHPACPTYEEVLERYLDYATALRDVVPDSELMGPVMCCWYDFWGTGPGPARGPYQPFLPWFLEQVRLHDEDYGRRTLDVVDVHYYPQSDVYNDRTDAETAARRLRSTRSLYDPEYVDESWIAEPVRLIPRLQETIAATYPDTPLAISEWNFGADTTMNGALAIADVLGILGREGVYMAAYWRSPPVGSPGYLAFKMHGNYDGQGTAFEGTSIPVSSPDVDRMSAFAAVASTGHLQVMLINKEIEVPIEVRVALQGFKADEEGMLYQLSAGAPDVITEAPLTAHPVSMDVALPPYSISVLSIAPMDEEAG